MIPFLLSAMLAVQVGPLGPDAPAREPQMAANSSMVALTFGAGKAIYFSASHDSGKTFAAPVKVAEAGVIPLSRHRGPRIALSGNTIVITAVAGKIPDGGPHAHGLPSDGDLFVWRSKDSGKTWSAGKTINDVPGSATEGLHALASDGKHTLFAAWLDKRGAKGTKLYAARSMDEGVTWSKNIEVYQSPGGSICECCHPSVAIDAAGRLLVMWRNSLGGARDMYLSASRDGVTFPAPEKLGNGTWRIDACPMDGGGLAVSPSPANRNGRWARAKMWRWRSAETGLTRCGPTVRGWKPGMTARSTCSLAPVRSPPCAACRPAARWRRGKRTAPSRFTGCHSITKAIRKPASRLDVICPLVSSVRSPDYDMLISGFCQLRRRPREGS